MIAVQLRKIAGTLAVIAALTGCSSTSYSERKSFVESETPRTQEETSEDFGSTAAEIDGLSITQVQYSDDWRQFIVHLRYEGQPEDENPFEVADEKVRSFESRLEPRGYQPMRRADEEQTDAN